MLTEDRWAHLRRLTPARIALGRAGNALPTSEVLAFRLQHAQARDAVHVAMDSASIARDVRTLGFETVQLKSAAVDRASYLRRPDLGRTLAPGTTLERGDFDVSFVIADGLSALAIHRHAAALIAAFSPELSDWRIAPVAIVEQARVAVGDEIGAGFGASLTVMLIGERPGLSAPDSLGVYLTWDPRPGRTDAERNCISNIRDGGLTYALATHKILFLMNEARRRKLTGVNLKEGADQTLSS